MDFALFEKYRSLIKKESGIHLADDKIDLLQNRLNKRLRSLGIQDLTSYFTYLQSASDTDELVNLIDAVSTNVTYFYREHEHFVFFRRLMERYKADGKRRIRIWCAASSSGEEPYTLAMEIRNVWGANLPDVKILATDICTRVLSVAVRGVYEDRQLEKLPEEYKKKFFAKVNLEDETRYEVDNSLKSLVTYRKMNLAKFPYDLKGPIDVIFCRNVMIYFDRALREKIVHEFERLMPQNGYLVLSHSENMIGISHSLTTEQVAVYRK